MPHQCVRCNQFYEDGSNEIIEGCRCGAKLFFFIRKEKLEKMRSVQEQFVALSVEEKKQIEKDVFNVMGVDEETQDEPVILDIESIRVLKPGKFELDLVHLFDKEKPIIFKLAEGKYVIDLPETFRRRNTL